MASGWNLWVWLECIGVVSGYVVYKEVYRYPHNNYFFPIPLVFALFSAATSLLLCSLLKMFFVLIIYVIIHTK